MGDITGMASHTNIPRKVAPSRQMDPVEGFESEAESGSSFRFIGSTSVVTRLVSSVFKRIKQPSGIKTVGLNIPADEDIVSRRGTMAFESLKAVK